MNTICPNCDEAILPGETTRPMRDLGSGMVEYHEECFIRMIMGSAEHQEKRCSCYGGPGEPEDLSRRECARRAFAVFQRHARPGAAEALRAGGKALWN